MLLPEWRQIGLQGVIVVGPDEETRPLKEFVSKLMAETRSIRHLYISNRRQNDVAAPNRDFFWDNTYSAQYRAARKVAPEHKRTFEAII